MDRLESVNFQYSAITFEVLLTWGSSWESAGGTELLLFVPGSNPAHQGAQGDFTWLSTQNVSVQPQDLTRQHQSDSQSNEILELQQILIKLRSLNLFSRYLNGTNTEEETSSGSAGDQALSQILHLKKKPFYNDNSFQIFIFSFRFELLY